MNSLVSYRSSERVNGNETPEFYKRKMSYIDWHRGNYIGKGYSVRSAYHDATE